jgi:choline kinase
MVRAVILAAGRGTRLGKLTESVPKALLPIGPRAPGATATTCFLRRHIELLHGLGVSDIVVVTGFKHELIRQAVTDWQADARIVVNPDINRGCLYSFHVAVAAFPELLDGTSDTLLMDADTVYPRQVLAQLLDSPAGSAVLVSEKSTHDGEEALAYGTREKLVYVGKTPNAACRKNVPCLGEETGIVLYASDDHQAIRTHLQELIDCVAARHAQAREPSGVRRPDELIHEELTQRLVEEGCVAGLTFSADVPFIEVDTPEDYRAAREECYPAVLRMEQALQQ